MPCQIASAQHRPALFPFESDRGVAGILLHDRISAENILGKEIDWQDGDEIQQKREMKEVRCYNSDRSEILLAYNYDHRIKNTVQVMRVLLAVDAEKRGIHSDSVKCSLDSVSSFVTLRDVALGLSVSEIAKRFGQSYRAGNRDGEVVLKYRIESDTSSLLRHYAEIGYFGNYYFRNGKLIEFEFGFQPKKGPLF